MSTFSTPLPAGAASSRKLAFVPNGTDVPLRYAGDQLMWIGIAADTAISAIAAGCITRTTVTTAAPGDVVPVGATIFQLTPLPQTDPPAFKGVRGGLPVQYVAIVGATGSLPAADDWLRSGATLARTSTNAAPTAFMAIALQDRLCRDPATWAEAIAASGACDARWAGFITELAGLGGGRNFRLLDHTGAPLTVGSFDVTVGGGAPVTVTLSPAMAGDTGIAVPANASVAIAARQTAGAILAAGDADVGAFEVMLQLPPGQRMAQFLNANEWLAPSNAGTPLQRYRLNNRVEPIVDGTPYFARLVEDLRRAKPAAAGAPGGKVQMAGWGFTKDSETSPKYDWTLVPEDAGTSTLALIRELTTAGVNVQVLVNKFVQLNANPLTEVPWLVPLLFLVYAGSMPLQAFGKLPLDPAEYAVVAAGVIGLIALLNTDIDETLIRNKVEISQSFLDAANAISPAIATWSPYPATFADNPLVPNPATLAGHQLRSISRLGVYHQKMVNILAADGTRVSYLGGIDLSGNRTDTPLHRVRAPFHDVQVRITGPSVSDVFLTFSQRAAFDQHPATIPDVVPNAAGTHLVQIARTYFKPAAGSATPLPFAPTGESTPLESIKAAMRSARDFIYIEDQYFTPPDEYVVELIAAAGRGVRALMITVPITNDQLFGHIRRTDVLKALKQAWGDRLYVGTPLRRFMHERPGFKTNVGRLRLVSDLTKTATSAEFATSMRMPSPPFWAFIGSELVLVTAIASSAGNKSTVEIVRAPATDAWGAQPSEHPEGSPVMAVQVPCIYVHAKVMIVDDAWMFVGSSNVNRRGFFHDGELDSFTISQHLRGDPQNPARTLRCRLMGEHLGLSPELALSLLRDPLSALAFYQSRSWYEGRHWQPLTFFGSSAPDIALGLDKSLKTVLGPIELVEKGEIWPLLVDPTTGLDTTNSKGPEYL